MRLLLPSKALFSAIEITRKCPLRGHILAPPEGLRAPGLLPVVNPGVDPGSQGVIPKRFKRKKYFVTKDGRTDVQMDRQT